MRRNQRGVTFLGWVVLLLPVAIIVYCGIRLTPVYLNYMRVARALDELAAETRSSDPGTGSLQVFRNSLDKRFDIEGIDHPTVKDIDIHREEDHWVAIANYEDVVPVFANLSLVVQFNKQVEMQ
jgi:hypothetical protein